MRDYTKCCYKERIYILCNTYAIVITLDFAQGKKEKNFFYIQSFVPNKRFSSQSEAVIPGLTEDLCIIRFTPKEASNDSFRGKQPSSVAQISCVIVI